MMGPDLFGLVLAGGTSSRMRRDKAALLYDGRAQLQRAGELLARHVSTVFVSVRGTQLEDPLRNTWPLIVDGVPGEGPIVGIRSALTAHPDRSWLVLACDLPFLSDSTLSQLTGKRVPTALATAYRNVKDGLPEPLCAIWESHAAAALAEYQSRGGRCPRKFLMQNHVPLLDALDEHALDNVNTPGEYHHALTSLSHLV